jgi:hypothetical protein
MGIFRTNDPTAFDDIDGIIIDETAPPSAIQGVAANIVILVGQFERGSHDLTQVGSVGELFEAYGNNLAYEGLKALQNKKFGRLKIIRVEPTSSAKGTLTLDDGGGSPVNVMTVTAKYKGVYGNSLKVTVAAGTTSGKKITIEDTTTNAVLPIEVYDNVDLTAYASAAVANAAGIFSASRLVDVNVLAVTANPENMAATALASGSDGSLADTDYQAAIAKAGVEGAGNILFLDVYNTTRNGYLKTHAADTQDKMCVLAGAEGDSVSTAISAVGSLRDDDGRLIYAYPWVQTNISGSNVYVSPASFYGALLSQSAPNIDPAYVQNSQFLAGITGLKLTLTRSDYISLNAAGISAFEFDADIGYKIKNGVTTHILNTEKQPVLRRRMTDYLTNSAARFLKNYQNAVNSAENRLAVKAAIEAFVAQNQANRLLPRDSELRSGKATLVDVESLNTDATIAAGFFYVLWKQRIYSSMRYIVLKAQIGTSVAVTEG